MFFFILSLSLQVGGYFNFVLWRFINPGVDFMVFPFSFFIFFYFRYQFFLQVKKDILQGRLPVTTELAAELAALALQCKFYFFYFFVGLFRILWDPVAFSAHKKRKKWKRKSSRTKGNEGMQRMKKKKNSKIAPGLLPIIRRPEQLVRNSFDLH